MKKILNILIILSVVCFVNVVHAGPFSDVPANHWAYDAVNKLAQAGILEGYGDGSFKGDKTITRYEMAIIVGKAMEKKDKANEEQKALIDKLSTEFSKELENLGVRVKALEDKDANAWKISGYARFRYEWGNQASDNNRATLNYYSHYPQGTVHSQVSNIIFVDKQFDANNYAHTTTGALVNNGPGETDWQFFEGYYGHKMGTSELKIGRMLAAVGDGFLWQNCYSDGIGMTFGAGTNVTTRIFAVNHANLNWFLGDVKFSLNKDTQLWVGRAVDRSYNNDDHYVDNFLAHARTTATGFTYTGIPDITLKGAYGVNSCAVAKYWNNGGSAKGMYIQAKYKGANPGIIGSFGFWVGYRKADNGFDIMSNMSGEVLDGNLSWIYPSQGGYANNVRGFEVGYEMTPFPSSVLQLKYAPLKALTLNDAALLSVGQPPLTNMDRKYFVSQLTWYY